jgi:hypothetical protein
MNCKHQKPAALAVCLSLCAANLPSLAVGEPILLRPATNLLAGAAVLDVGDYAIPCVTDWNGDGRKDLIVGYQPAWKLAVYLNCGTDAQPAFTNAFNLQAGGADIYLPASGCGSPAPWVCDFDGDGKRDLLVGEGNSGYVYFYRNTNTDAQPILAPGVRLMVGGNPLTVPARATPYLHDWDEDGVPDLLCGAGDGCVYFFKNLGSQQAPVYAAGVQLQVGGSALKLGSRSVVRVFDWDGDGLEDIVGSSSTGVYWCRNVGSNRAPQLQAPVALKAPVSGSGLTPINTGARMRLDLVDWNHDGVMDLLLGNADGTISYFEGYRFAFTGLSPEPTGGLVLQWSSAPFLKYHLLAGAAPDTLTRLIATNLPSGGKTTAWTNRPQASQEFYQLRLAP